MKLVSDFDGVWTLPHDEARAQGEVLDGTLAGWGGPDTAAWIRDARAATLAAPERYGWAPGGRMSAFADEDPFAPHSALLHFIHVHAVDDPLARRLNEAVRENGHASLDAFGGWSHAEGVRRVAATRGPGVLPDAADAGRRMLEGGLEVAVVSNSGTDKLAEWFAQARVPAVVHPAHVSGSMRLRGSARKFVLDPERTDALAFGGVTIDVARPAYDAVLRDELPDAVVGDVFSLDLALPLALRRREKAFAHMQLFWLIRDYTPRWLVDALAPAIAGEVEMVEGGLGGVAAALLAQRRS
jgi:hypothetical protein